MAANMSSLQVHEVQRGNPVLKYIRNVKWEYSQDIVPDYVMASTCALFVSVKFHFRHPTVRACDMTAVNGSTTLFSNIYPFCILAHYKAYPGGWQELSFAHIAGTGGR